MRAFLRLLYTDQIDPLDWQSPADPSGHAAESNGPPLEILLGVAVLAQKYLVNRVLASTVEAFKARLEKGRKFEGAWRLAVSHHPM